MYEFSWIEPPPINLPIKVNNDIKWRENVLKMNKG